MSLTVPFRPPPQTRPAGEGAGDRPARGVAVGPVELRSLTAYLLAWAAVLFAVQLLVFWSSHEVLHRLGALTSISRAVATVLDDPLPESGVLPALELGALLPWALAVAAAGAVLWLLTVLAVVLVHNGICAVTAGPRVHLR